MGDLAGLAESIRQEGLLEGTGKGKRHVKVRSVGGVRKRALATLVRATASLGEVPLGRRAEVEQWSFCLSEGRPHMRRKKLPADNLLAGSDPGPTHSRLKPTKKPDEIYPLKLTQQKRESMIHHTRLKNKLMEKLKETRKGTQIVGVTRKELDHLNEELAEAALYAPDPHKKRLVAVLHKVTDLLSEDHAGLVEEEQPKIRKTAPKEGALLYQFKITLLDIKPAIWRRIQVPDCTLADLHEYIQAAFGWENYHLHQFMIDGERYGPPAPDGQDFDLDFEDETEVLLSKLIPRSGRKSRWIYEYDFGDGWRHEILFEGFPISDPKAKYPLCLEGERACPPEDCGGRWGYGDYLVAIADSQHERHEELLEWRGPFDPEAFDAEKATKEMRKTT